MFRTAIALLLALALPAAALAHEDPYPHSHRDRREARKDRRALRDDLRDAQHAQWLLTEFERTWALLDRVALRQVELRVQGALEEEVREATWETSDAAREARRSGREARSARWAGPRERFEERREAGDDRRDFMQAVAYRDRVSAIRGEWASLRDQRTFAAMMRKHALLEELVHLSRMEIREDRQEMREDHR
jgi:hypothetical protein